MNEYIERMHRLYDEFITVCEEEKLHNVLTDLENMYPEFYNELIQAVIRRNKIKQHGALLVQP